MGTAGWLLLSALTLVGNAVLSPEVGSAQKVRAAHSSVWASSSPTLSMWQAAYGPPTRSLEASLSSRSEGEPLLIYWIQVTAAPLGVGPAVPGTLVANFKVHPSIGESSLEGFTFLGTAGPAAVLELEGALREEGWVHSEKEMHRSGGVFRELSLIFPTGRRGTLAVRRDTTSAHLADGRPSPSFWLHVSSAQAEGGPDGP